MNPIPLALAALTLAPSAAAQPAPAAVPPEVHFGGPDQPPGALRDLLRAKVDAAPPGSEIVWATYYFRDQDLAERLVAAQRRGVRVRVRIEGRPRRERANDQVIATLRAGLGDGLRVHRPWLGLGHLHAKVYAFSGPRPEVLIGSFNPSGDQAADPAVLADIGDQDRGENLLVGFQDPAAAAALRRHAERLWTGEANRFHLGDNRPVDLVSVRFYYFPRFSPRVVERRLARLRPGDRVQAAVSHMDDGPFARELAKAARRGVRVDVVVHDTARRVPPAVVRDLDAAGASIRRYCTPERLPMHAKFVLIERGGQRSSWFGSLNYTAKSQLLNTEVLARSTQPRLVAGLESRFRTIADTAARTPDCGAGRRIASAGAGGEGR
ncbi:MAG: phospholipase D family protein [Alphaproteobacteria bacterium]|nr:phospholipase D family protein [Alphaproteobacteria bacterium]MBU1512916.1 phospholipase D family protein [Alphaproteobacteria bacterium]MBU2096643.1 phospholipase D family protein [Alphaproteobacteria bacterium]MBU2150526.1 phospholipase D family protein [Alphaproteobacteria bacterium]MBU2306545.1 phospholipase D family protein [Alphaproteobacteria bacterium]